VDDISKPIEVLIIQPTAELECSPVAPGDDNGSQEAVNNRGKALEGPSLLTVQLLQLIGGNAASARADEEIVLDGECLGRYDDALPARDTKHNHPHEDQGRCDEEEGRNDGPCTGDGEYKHRRSEQQNAADGDVEYEAWAPEFEGRIGWRDVDLNRTALRLRRGRGDLSGSFGPVSQRFVQAGRFTQNLLAAGVVTQGKIARFGYHLGFGA
jgi:hypothetical protein